MDHIGNHINRKVWPLRSRIVSFCYIALPRRNVAHAPMYNDHARAALRPNAILRLRLAFGGPIREQSFRDAAILIDLPREFLKTRINRRQGQRCLRQ